MTDIPPQDPVAVPPAERPYIWTRANIIKAFHDWNTKHGEPPRMDDWNKASPDHPSHATVRVRFRRWNVAMEAAGFVPRDTWCPAARRYMKEAA